MRSSGSRKTLALLRTSRQLAGVIGGHAVPENVSGVAAGALLQAREVHGATWSSRDRRWGTVTSLTATSGQKRNVSSGRFFSSLPDHEQLCMPALSPTMSQGNIVAWKKKEGDAVQPGDVYCEVETDKATIEWEAQEEGWLAKILVGDGSQGVEVGVPVAVLVEEEEDIGAFKDGYSPVAANSSNASTASSGVSEAPSSPTAAATSYPQHEVMTMPALSPTMAEGTLVSWKKSVGDEISAGDVLAEIETDKATMEWEAQEDGVLAQILVQEGTAGVKVGTPVFVQVEGADEVGAFAGYTAADASGAEAGTSVAEVAEVAEVAKEEKKAVPTTTPTPAPAAVPTPMTPTTPRTTSSRVVASPYARKLAAENNVSLESLQGSGPNGRIVAADVLGAPASSSAASASAFTDISNSNIRKIIAQRLLESKQQIPHYYLSTTCRVDTVSALRAKLNASLADGKLSMNDFVIKAAAMALKKVPEVNAEWCGDFIRQYSAAHVSVAVQTPAGLMVPVVRNAEKKGLAAISSDVKTLAAKAKEGRLDPAESVGGTFTISNLGMFGVGNFAAIVNPPQACILAVGATEKRVVVGDVPGTFEEATVMGVTLSCDHRVIDGAVGATWLAAFKGYLEDPASMLL